MDTGVGRHFLLQGIFPTQRWNPGLLHCRQVLYRLGYEGGPFSQIAHSKIDFVICTVLAALTRTWLP